MAAPVIIPELQFVDADGHPYAGGTLATYIVGTTTPKATWVDPDGTALQTNPAILDAAGRCLMWGDGLYRLILRDAAGNQIWDQPATTIVSAAMAPVVAAPTIADALILLGINDLIAAEADARAAADATEQAARIAADNAERDARIAGDANLQAQIDAINATLSGMGGRTEAPIFQFGYASSDSSGYASVTYTTPYTTAYPPVVVATLVDATLGDEWVAISTSTLTGFTVSVSQPSGGSLAGAAVGFYWMAVAA